MAMPSVVCYCDANCAMGMPDCCSDTLQAFQPGMTMDDSDFTGSDS